MPCRPGMILERPLGVNGASRPTESVYWFHDTQGEIIEGGKAALGSLGSGQAIQKSGG